MVQVRQEFFAIATHNDINNCACSLLEALLLCAIASAICAKTYDAVYSYGETAFCVIWMWSRKRQHKVGDLGAFFPTKFFIEAALVGLAVAAEEIGLWFMVQGSGLKEAKGEGEREILRFAPKKGERREGFRPR
jgi:hypothetical protein